MPFDTPPGVPEMPDAFLRTACSWISVDAIATVAGWLRERPDFARARGDRLYAPVEPVHTGDTGLGWLCEQFLKRFRLPPDLLQLAQAIHPGVIDDATLAQLYDLRFRGEVLTPETSDDLPAGAFLAVYDEEATLFLLMRPLSVIVEKVVEIATSYREAAHRLGDATFYSFEHFQPEPFAVYLEYVVARSMFGDRLQPHPFRAERMRRQAFPAFNIVSAAPVDRAFLEEARQRARLLAEQHYGIFDTAQP